MVVAVGVQDADGEVAQAGHGARGGAGADLGGVFGEGDVAEVVQRLDGPVAVTQSARREGLARAAVRLVTAFTGPRTRPSPTRQARTLPRPWRGGCQVPTWSATRSMSRSSCSGDSPVIGLACNTPSSGVTRTVRWPRGIYW